MNVSYQKLMQCRIERKGVKQEMENVCHIIKAWHTIEISFVLLHSFRYLKFHL